MKEIPLTQGKVALVDDEDYAAMSHHRWYVACGYAAARTRGPHSQRRGLRMHRMILDIPDGLQADHIDGNRLNNQRHNLRVCTCAQNQYNRKKPITGTTSQYKGVHWVADRRRWRASIKVDNQFHHIGHFVNEEAAAHAYDAAAREYFGEFARLNFPEVSP